jgi:hypothetical protein
LEGLDAEIKKVLAEKALQTPVTIVIDTEDLEGSFESARAQAASLAAQGNVAYQVVMPVEMEEGTVEYPVHVAQLAKESGKEFFESIHAGVHPLIAHTRQAGAEITAFYTH